MSPTLFLDALLLGVLSLAVRHDLRSRLIPNRVTLPAALIGLALNTALFGFDGLKLAALGWLAGAAILIVPFVLGWMGAGDVKLAAALGALKGPAFAVETVLYAMVVAGVMAAIFLFRRQQLVPALRALPVLWQVPGALRATGGYGRIPFGPAVALGALIALFSIQVVPFVRGLG